MQIKLYNTLSRKKEVFKSIKKGQVSMYACGPTVYLYAHIGNLRAYIFEDILKRTLLFNKLKVKHIMNITDVGHLTSDADTGEDKIELSAKKEKKDAYQIADFYTKAFKQDLIDLNILPPNTWCKATDHIKDQIEWIKKLEKKGFTYKTSDGIYFHTSKFKDYGKLAQLKKQDLKAGARINIGEKKNKTDFALWKFSTKDKKRQMEWKSPWGVGFPGWHIECSVMATKYLGKQFDIHCGGIDHIQIHHTNEIAQTEAVTKKKWVNYWLHGEFLILDKEKMSKSKGGFLTLKTLKEKNYDPLAFRYFILNSHYKKQVTFSYEALKSAQTALEKIRESYQRFQTKDNKKPSKKETALLTKFHNSINDNLNTPEALAVLWKVIKSKDLTNSQKTKLMLKFDEVLGLKIKTTKKTIPKEIIKIAEQRLKARKNKDFKKSDILREKIRKKGYSIEDLKNTYKLKPK